MNAIFFHNQYYKAKFDLCIKIKIDKKKWLHFFMVCHLILKLLRYHNSINSLNKIYFVIIKCEKVNSNDL